MNKEHTCNYNLILIILLIIPVILFSSSINAMGVRPLVIDLNITPGESEAFELTLTPSEDDEVVNLNFYRPVQMETGGLSYQKIDSETYPVLNWIELEQRRIKLPAGENRKIKGTVTVPFKAHSNNTVIIMVEPEVEDADQGVTFKVRYAVRLNINVQSAGMHPRGEIGSFDFLTDTGGYPVINTIFHNTSEIYYDTSAEATVRDEQGRLVERIDLKTPVAWQSGRDVTTIYPGARVLYTGTVKKPLYPGEYQVRLFYHYANGRQIIEKRMIFVKGNTGLQQELRAISLSPDSIKLDLRPGSTSSRVIELENNSEKEISLTVSGRDIVRDYPNSIYKALEIQLRGQQKIVVPPYGKKRVVLTVKAPEDIAPGGYYGFIDFIDNTGDGRKVYSTAVDVVTGEDRLIEKVEIMSIYYNNADKGGDLFSVELINKGDIHLIPEGKLKIRDSKGNLIDILDLTLQEGVDRILPQQSDLMIARGINLNPGNYTAEILITKEGQVISSKELNFTVD